MNQTTTISVCPTNMNNHLLPPPYNQSTPQSWLQRSVLQPLGDILLGESPRLPPRKPSVDPILLPPDQNDLFPIRVVCISDTHNTRPPLPPGDILIHAGDLTARGTFDELQAQLQWLSAQPHAHKVVVAGNHDLILDEACDDQFLTRGEDNSALKRKRLDWGEIRYLQNEAVTLEIEPIIAADSAEERCDSTRRRQVKIYGSPLTPEFGRWAFQYPAIRDVWTGLIPADTDILVVHGPPALYGDYDGENGPTGKQKAKGDGYLLREIRRVRPKMVICGHIHGAFGISNIEHDGMQAITDKRQMHWGGFGVVEIVKILWAKITAKQNIEQPAHTLVVNAAFAPSGMSSEDKGAILVDLSLDPRTQREPLLPRSSF
ncbi:Metallo-dependent phosphatase-like protein [Aspergillus pseudodeflectus]|uniref:Metallo-dependent phosphatase-like protein n=1 Tax=Aspergillus pseudodeflectus TaxID=176178 RepID=A0ABR4JDB2_9EURO